MMKGSWIVVGAAVVLLLSWTIGVQAAPAGAETPRTPPEMNKAPDAKRPPMDGAPRMPSSAEGATDRLNQILTIACTEGWAARDEETQKLVDKMLADLKVMIQTELGRVGALEELTQAARGGDEAAVKEAMQKVRTVTEKLRQDGEAANKDFKALVERLRRLRPAPVPVPPKDGAETKGANAGEPMQK
jgi:hypothetical protein